MDIILAAEPEIRLTAFLSVLAAMALWELAAPRRRRDIPRVIRWSNNLALVVIDTAILRLSFPILAVGLAVLAEDLAALRTIMLAQSRLLAEATARNAADRASGDAARRQRWGRQAGTPTAPRFDPLSHAQD